MYFFDADFSGWLKRQESGSATSSQEGQSEDDYSGPSHWEPAGVADWERYAELIHWEWGKLVLAQAKNLTSWSTKDLLFVKHGYWSRAIKERWKGKNACSFSEVINSASWSQNALFLLSERSNSAEEQVCRKAGSQGDLHVLDGAVTMVRAPQLEWGCSVLHWVSHPNQS